MSRSELLRFARQLVYEHERKVHGRVRSWLMAWHMWLSLRSCNDATLREWVRVAQCFATLEAK